MQTRMPLGIVLNAELMAVWGRNPQEKVIVHSNQSHQHPDLGWKTFLNSHG